MRCNNCYVLEKCANGIHDRCPKKDKGPKCKKCGRPHGLPVPDTKNKIHCSTCQYLVICRSSGPPSKCPKIVAACKEKCRKCGGGDDCNECWSIFDNKKGAENIMKVIDCRENDTPKTLTLCEIPFNRTFEFIDVRKPNHCSIFIKMAICHTYLRRFADKHDQTWAFDVVKGKLCQFNNRNEVRMLEAEFHVIGELNG